jgi:hypothetical protein
MLHKNSLTWWLCWSQKIFKYFISWELPYKSYVQRPTNSNVRAVVKHLAHAFLSYAMMQYIQLSPVARQDKPRGGYFQQSGFLLPSAKLDLHSFSCCTDWRAARSGPRIVPIFYQKSSCAFIATFNGRCCAPRLFTSVVMVFVWTSNFSDVCFYKLMRDF